jgi:hypothetical protein
LGDQWKRRDFVAVLATDHHRTRAVNRAADLAPMIARSARAAQPER